MCLVIINICDHGMIFSLTFFGKSGQFNDFFIILSFNYVFSFSFLRIINLNGYGSDIIVIT